MDDKIDFKLFRLVEVHKKSGENKSTTITTAITMTTTPKTTILATTT